MDNQITKTNLKLNRSRLTLDRLTAVTTNINNKKSKLEKQIYSHLFEYSSIDILNLLDITDLTKEHIIKNISSICIYTVKKIVDDMFVVRYMLNNREYEFTIAID